MSICVNDIAEKFVLRAKFQFEGTFTSVYIILNILVYDAMSIPYK